MLETLTVYYHNMCRLFELIEQYDCITIYRHIAPDADALGSQYGLKQWIEDRYPDKRVYALGKNTGSKYAYFPKNDMIENEVVKASLAIILDTANADRIDDDRWQTARYRVKVDHHIFVEKFADDEYIEDLAGATCEILASYFMKHKITLSSIAAQYLYSGMIADTLRFSIPTTTPDTLHIAAYLVACGVDVQRANEDNFSTPLKQFYYENYIRSHCQIVDGCFAYAIINKADYEAFDISFNEAKEKVFVLGGVHEFEAWALFVEKEIDATGIKRYSGSLRSKHTVINHIAANYHGGGHRYACGVKNLSEQDIQAIIQDMLHVIKLKKDDHEEIQEK